MTSPSVFDDDDDEKKDKKKNEVKEEKEEENKPLVVVERMEHLHIMSIGINRPEKRNCVNEATAKELYKAFYDFQEDDDMYCAVFHGIGGNFCAGYDLEELASIDEKDISNTIAMIMMDRGPMGPTRMELSKPVIGAIDGYCVAGGLELALMCDLRVMDESAKVGVLNRRFGVPLIDGGSVRLPELIGLSRALDLILTGRIVEAKEAFSMGIVNRLVQVGTAYGQAMNLAKEIVIHPQQCLRADRASAYHATFASHTLEESLQHEADNALHIISKESLKGARKFVDGLGKHGKFNVSPVVGTVEWEKERAQMKKEAEEGQTIKEKDHVAADKEKMS